MAIENAFCLENNRAKVAFVNFNVKENTFSGNSGCNSISGSLILKKNYVGVDKNITSTKMACPDPKPKQDERSFLAALLKINKNSINKQEFELGQGDVVLLKFKRN